MIIAGMHKYLTMHKGIKESLLFIIFKELFSFKNYNYPLERDIMSCNMSCSVYLPEKFLWSGTQCLAIYPAPYDALKMYLVAVL
mgnify:CR=1 FL=1